MNIVRQPIDEVPPDRQICSLGLFDRDPLASGIIEIAAETGTVSWSMDGDGTAFDSWPW